MISFVQTIQTKCMKKIFCCAAALAGFFLTSCMDHSNVYDTDHARKEYETSWEETMGNVDPAQTWNTAASRSANVAVDYGTKGTYTIKVYTFNPYNTLEDNYLLAEYTIEDGNSKTIQLDIPSALKTVYVACIDGEGNRAVQAAEVKDGMKVTFDFENNSSRGVVSSDEWKEFSKEDCSEFLTIIPENQNNTGKVAQNFSYLSAGDFVIYPMYSVTGGKNELGLYYYENGKKKEEVIWSQEDCKIQAYYDGKTWENGSKEGWNDYKISKDSPWNDSRGISKLRAQGVKISLPVGTRMGFFVNNAGTKFYSEASLNGGKAHGATFYVNGNLYLGFEDWTGDYDFNDIVCYIAPTHPIILDKEDATQVKKMQYRIAYEDLGGANDFDFNDVVLGVEHVSGHGTATVKLLAAGGTYPVTVSYNGTSIFDEVHSAFGVDPTTMVNTGYTTVTTLPAKEIEVGSNFSILSSAPRFVLTVVGENGTSNQIAVPDQEGKTPQAFVVADPSWEWPHERQCITDKYKNFSSWVSNAAKDDWYGAIWENADDANQNENVYPDLEEGSRKIDVEITANTIIPAAEFANATTTALLTVRTTGAVEVIGVINENKVFTHSIDKAGLIKVSSLNGLLSNLKANGLTLSFDKPEKVSAVYLKNQSAESFICYSSLGQETEWQIAVGKIVINGYQFHCYKQDKRLV